MTMPSFPISRVLILGASGQFGSRLCRRLVQLGGLHLFLGGRDRQKLEATQGQLHAARPDAKIDILAGKINASGFLDLLYSRRLNLVVHLAGPFQGQDYMVANACLRAGVPYVDIADGREFVTQFSSLDAAALAKGIPVIPGASTAPGLSSAIIDAMLDNFSRLEAIDYGICGGVQTGLRPPPLQTSFSQCRRPYALLQDGRAATPYCLERPPHPA